MSVKKIVGYILFIRIRRFFARVSTRIFADILAKCGAFTRGHKGFARHAGRIVNPSFFRLVIAARGRALSQYRTSRVFQSIIDIHQFRRGFSLNP